MEKRLVLFLCLTTLILGIHFAVMNHFYPPQPNVVADGEDLDETQPDTSAENSSGPGVESTPPEEVVAAETPGTPAETTSPEVPNQRFVLGSAAPDSNAKLLVYLNNRGAAVERIELVARDADGDFKYTELTTNTSKGGYLGYLALGYEDEGPCRVQVVGAGTPAALARPASTGQPTGLQVGDVIVAAEGTEMPSPAAFRAFLMTTEPGQHITLDVQRGPGPALKYAATLEDRPLAVIRPEVEQAPRAPGSPLSYRMTLRSIGESSAKKSADEIAGLPSMYSRNWQAKVLSDPIPGVEFRYTLSAADLAGIGEQGSLEVVKRFRLPTPVGTGESGRDYHLEFEFEITNRGAEPQRLVYQLDGPNSLPLEGWWYSNKINQGWGGAGARDVLWRPVDGGREMRGCKEIYDQAQNDDGEIPWVQVHSSKKLSPFAYVGVDSQFFACAFTVDQANADALQFKEAWALPAGTAPTFAEKGLIRTTNVSCRLISETERLAPGESITKRVQLFSGPKDKEVLQQYNMEDANYYGWFGMFSKPLATILHVFHALVHNYGIAIIMLTVLVRGCMFPLSRKAAKNAQMMQELQPEIKKLTEKYKNDMEKRAAAQRELFAKHNYNPLGGCLMMFVQLPIFMGLYRCLSVDIELRQAPLIPGVEWCSNLAGPDMALDWSGWMWDWLSAETGWLGPYFNVLPLITISLFLVHQKLFMPPPTDEQQKLQQTMMKYMMLFFAVMFFKVASGLCIYFIASSLWGIAERKLLPKKDAKEESVAATPKKASKVSVNGTAAEQRAKEARERKKKQRKR